MKKHIPTNESGRSMVEMLGVLAIMGVLSIGAVAGYRWAMDKYEANEILNEVRKRAITSSQARISGHEIDLTEYGDNGRINGKYGVVADNAYNGDDRFFTLTVSDIPQGVCDKVVDVNWQMPAAILLDGVAVDDNTVCGEGNNEMLFAFANDLKSGAVAGGEGEETPDPNEEHCWGHGTWDGTSCACEAGWSGDDCSMTQFCDTRGTCYDCDAYGSFLADAADCSKCDGSRSPRFMDTNGYCRSCSYSLSYEATAAECAKCDSSSTLRFMSTDGYCVRCSDSSGYKATADECAKCDKSSTPRFMDTNGYCRSCNYSYGLEATAAECAKCANSSTPRFLSTDGRCYSCSESDAYSAIEAECGKCDASSTPRKMFGDYCGLINCGANQFQTTTGSCRSCGDSSGVSATEVECAKCDKSGIPRYMNGSSCYKCPIRLSSGSLNTQDKCQSCHGTWNAETKKCS